MADNYTLDGDNYTQEEVLEAATAKNLSIEDYIAQYYPDDTTDLAEPKEKAKEVLHEKIKDIDTSWGSKVIDVFKAPFMGSEFADPNASIKKGEHTAYAKLQYQRRKQEAIRQSDEGYKKQKDDFGKNLDKIFDKNPTLFGDILKQQTTSLQDKDIEAGDFGSPEKYIKNYLKESLGGFGWFGGERQEVMSQDLGLTTYDKLTNEDIDLILAAKFDTKLHQEKTNKVKNRSNKEIASLEKSNISLEKYFKNTQRPLDIETLHTKEKLLANLIEKYNHGTFAENETKESIWEDIKKEKVKLEKDPTKMLMDLTTGQLVFASNQKATENKLSDNKNLQQLDITGKQKELDKLIGIHGDPETALDVLKQEYQRSALALARLNKEMNFNITKTVDNPAYTVTPPKDNIALNIPKQITVTKSIKDWMRSDYGGLDDVHKRKIERYKEDLLEYTSSHEALKRMYLLNEGVQDIDISAAQHAKTSLKSLVTPFVGEYTSQKLIGSTERQVLDNVGAKMNELGFKMSPEDEKYLERSIGEQINEGLFGSGRILAEFYTINKFLKPVQAITGLNKYMGYLSSARWGKNGKTFTEYGMRGKIAAKTGKDINNVTKADVFNYATNLGMKNVGKHSLNNVASYVITGGIEGLKFEAITRFDTGGKQSGFATGFGFGIGGRMMSPLAPFLARKGFLKDINYKPIHLNTRKLFETGISQPASFVAGSEFGETMNAIVDDALGNKDLRIYMDEHYGDYGKIGQRLLVNHAIGIGFGQINKHGVLFNGFADFKSKVAIENNMRTARKKMSESARLAGVTDKMIGETYLNSKTNKQEPGHFFHEQVQNKIHKGLSDKNLSEYYKHWDVYSSMRQRLHGLYRAEGYMDPSRADEIVKDEMKSEIKRQKELGIDLQVEVVNNKALKKGQEPINVDADIVVKDGGKTKIYRFNAERYTPDIKAHEVSHDYFETMFGKDAMFKSDFMRTLGGIAKKIELAHRTITLKEAKELGNENLSGKTMSLEQAVKLEKFDLTSVRNNTKITQWEMFSHIAEQLGNKRNYYSVQNSNGFKELGSLISKFGKKAGQKYNLTKEADVVRWFRDYSSSVKKGRNVTELFKELKETVIDYEMSPVEIKKAEAEAARQIVEKGYESKDLDAQKNTFLENQRKSIERNTETPLYSIDKHLFKNDGTRKYKTLEEFKRSGEDFAQVYYKIFGGEKSVFDSKIKEGMTDKGIPDKFDPETRVNPMNEFVRKVKNKLLTRLNKNFNPDKGGGSLFGYFENTAIPYEKIRVSQEYIKEGGSTKTRLEDIGEMQAPTEARVKRFETQNILEQQFREAKAKKEGVELKTVSEEGRIFSEMMGRDKSGVQTKITEATKKQKIDLDKTKPIYKELKKWLTEVELIERDGKKVKPTKEADARPIGVLSKVMEIVSAEYGIPLKRLLANQTLDGTMRDKARDYIKNKVTEIREGVFPEGETPSGIATGAANTSWKSLYIKGARVKVSEGASKKAGQKASQTKRTDITNAEILEKVGINPKTGEYAKGTKFDSAIKELIKFDATIEAKQALTTLGRGIFSDSVIGEMGAGRPKGMASKNLEKQGFADQVNFLFEVQGKTFEKMFKRNMASIEDPVKAINKTLTEYFTDYRKRGNEFNISNADLRTIGKELHKEYKFTRLTPTKIASKAAKAIEMPNDLKSIDIKAGLEPIPFSLNTLSDIVEARAVTRVVAKALVEKYGDGVYEAMLVRGESGGKGVGPYRSLADVDISLGKGQNRFSLHEAKEAAVDFMSDIINSKGKKYLGPTSTMVEGQGNKAGQMRRLIDKKTGEWNQKALNEAYEAGEFNKKVLKDAVQALREAYKKGDITHTQARQWVEIHGGPMSGLIKLAGSFSVVPNMSVKEMHKNYGKDASNYVLEHTTPAQYVKARIYDYIINGGEAKKSAMDLTLKDYHTTLIPEKFDVMVNKTLQTDLPSWHLPGMDPIASRYYEANHPSDFGFGLRNFKTGKVYDHHPNLTVKQKQKLGKQLGEINNKLFPKGLRNATKGELNSKNLEHGKNIDKALANGRKKKKERRGMSTWDFDDTLATTKSGVRARIPNTDGAPKPSRKVIFLAGGAGSGKSNVVKKLGLEKDGFKIVNQDISLEWLKKNHGLPENMNDLTSAQRSTLGKLQHQARQIAKNKMMKYKGNADGVVVDGTGGSIKAMEKLVKEFKEKGYDVSMLFVETSLETALARNKARKERSLLDKIVERNHEAVQGNKPGFKKMFSDRFMEVKTDNLKQADAMPKELIDKMNNFVRSYEKVRLDAEQFASEGKEILDRGGKFDFTEFNVVTGGQRGPFFEKAMARAQKFGTKNQFVLTARPPEAQLPIYEFLKSQGLEIPLENITGLGNSTAEAKAMWMLKKFSEGYNDMYFADDAIQNVKAVKDVLRQLDVKSKVQQALASKNLDIEVNKMMEHSLGIESQKVFSKAEAKVRGKDIRRRRVFMRDSAADLELLIEPLYGKGKEGIKNKKWFSDNFIQPWERGIRDYNTARQSAKNDYMNLRKQNKDVVKEISKEVEGTTFTNDMAMRVYLWNKAGYKIPDLAKTTEAKLVEHIQNNPKLKAYAENFARITKQEKGLKEPGQNWWAETMAGEVTNIDRGVSRKQYLQEWVDIKNEIFTEVNLNKMESKLGTRWRENIEDMFDRMETGRTRSLKMDRGSAMMMNYLNGSIGSIMNFNTRSAMLQTISTTNFLNMRENNPIAAAKAMANIPQFSKDFLRIMNSDMLKQRRDGLAINVTEAEIASAAAGSKNPIQSIIAKVLKVGYTPTKLADSFAISFGGATFYRNRIKMYEKQGMKTKEAEKQAWLDFQTLSERTQQSSRADLLSKQQTSLLGRIILPFANTPMQMNRAGMKDILDISKGRYKGGRELSEKMGRISYYMGAQIAIFAGLQSAMFALMLNEDDVPEKTVERSKTYMLGSTTDSFLRGFGVSGAVLSAFKNAAIQYAKQSAKPGFTADYSEVGEALLNISPPIGSKFSKLDRAGDIMKWAKIDKNTDFKLELGNPSLEASLLTIEAITNAPLHGWHQNAYNIQHALSDDYEMWQRAHMLGGWTPFQVGVEKEDKEDKKKEKSSRKGFKPKTFKKKTFKRKTFN